MKTCNNGHEEISFEVENGFEEGLKKTIEEVVLDEKIKG